MWSMSGGEMGGRGVNARPHQTYSLVPARTIRWDWTISFCSTMYTHKTHVLHLVSCKSDQGRAVDMPKRVHRRDFPYVLGQ